MVIIFEYLYVYRLRKSVLFEVFESSYFRHPDDFYPFCPSVKHTKQYAVVWLPLCFAGARASPPAPSFVAAADGLDRCLG